MKKKPTSRTLTPGKPSKNRLPLNRFPITRLPLETLQAFVRFKLEEAKGGVRTLAPAPGGLLKSVEALPLWMSFAEYLKDAAQFAAIKARIEAGYRGKLRAIPCPCGRCSKYIVEPLFGCQCSSLLKEDAEALVARWNTFEDFEDNQPGGFEI